MEKNEVPLILKVVPKEIPKKFVELFL